MERRELNGLRVCRAYLEILPREYGLFRSDRTVTVSEYDTAYL